MRLGHRRRVTRLGGPCAIHDRLVLLGLRRGFGATGRRGLLGHRSDGNCRSRRGTAAKQLPDSTDHRLRLERFDQHRVTPDLPRTVFVDRLERPGQEHHRDMCQRGIRLDELRDVVAVTLRHAGVGQHDVRGLRRNSLYRMLSVANGDHADILVGERQLDHPLNGHAVVGEQEGLRHEIRPSVPGGYEEVKRRQ